MSDVVAKADESEPLGTSLLRGLLCCALVRSVASIMFIGDMRWVVIASLGTRGVHGCVS
jgi:hypothetical protein